MTIILVLDPDSICEWKSTETSKSNSVSVYQLITNNRRPIPTKFDDLVVPMSSINNSNNCRDTLSRAIYEAEVDVEQDNVRAIQTIFSTKGSHTDCSKRPKNVFECIYHNI